MSSYSRKRRRSRRIEDKAEKKRRLNDSIAEMSEEVTYRETEPSYLGSLSDFFDSMDEESSDYEQDSEDERRFAQEERDFERSRSQVKRPTKPKNFRRKVDRRSGMRKADRTERELTEKQIAHARGGGKLPKKLDATVKYVADCGRCKKPIFMDGRKKELGVGFGKTHRRQRPPDGHDLDYVVYKDELERQVRDAELSEEEDSSEERETRDLMKRHGTWNHDHIRLEHFDCNSRATKINQDSMSDSQARKGRKYVRDSLPTLKKRARKDANRTKRRKKGSGSGSSS